MDYQVNAEPQAIEIGAAGTNEILQNVRMILATLQGSVFLDRGFARTGEAIDKPEPKAMAKEVAGLYRAIQDREPRVEVTDIRFVQATSQAMNGQLVPQVRIRIKEGAL